ncbi:thioredoxin M chloroplastic [Fusarium heterosporum]|uniref:Thioredoxin M chloroplastic n=1 Tax=Fusarium heterosporum TaxID=42747 RepID=A0A8H5WM43_FUSHE|nr:thioredoxin M chloroplastic [Fusarium heterosporum]
MHTISLRAGLRPLIGKSLPRIVQAQRAFISSTTPRQAKNQIYDPPLLRDLVESGVGEEEGGVSLVTVEFDSPDIMSGNPNLAMTYMITSIPTLLSFDAGEAQTMTKLSDARKLADREFLKEWIRTEARRHGGRGGGGGGGSSLFGGLFGK